MSKETLDIDRKDVKDFCQKLCDLIFEYEEKLNIPIIVSELEIHKIRIAQDGHAREYSHMNFLAKKLSTEIKALKEKITVMEKEKKC